MSYYQMPKKVDLGFVSTLSMIVWIIIWIGLTWLLLTINPGYAAIWFIGFLVYWFFGPGRLNPINWLTDVFDRYINREEHEKYNRAVRIWNGQECPKCGSRQVTHVDKNSYSYDTTETITRTVRRYNKDDEYVGYTEEDYDALVTNHYSVIKHRCLECKGIWETLDRSI